MCGVEFHVEHWKHVFSVILDTYSMSWIQITHAFILHSWLFLIFGGVTFSDSKNKYGRNFRV